MRGLSRPVRIALVVLLVAGAALRLWFVLAYRPGFLGYSDAAAYVTSAHGPLFWNQYRPAGYGLLLRLLHAVGLDLTGSVVVQHLLGLGAAAFLFAAVTRVVRRPALALLPLGVVLLSGSELFLEHSVLTEASFTFLVAAALWCAVRALDAEGRASALWLVGAGVLAGVSTAVRPTGVAVVLVLAAWALGRRGSATRRVVLAGVVAVGFLAALGPYLVAQHHKTGTWGLSRASGTIVYARAAIFADCHDFTPPAGTRRLCEDRPPATRPTPNDYIFRDSSPAVRAFGRPPDPLTHPHAAYSWPPDATLGSFGRAAIRAQPLAYAKTVVQGLVKYVLPHAGPANMLDYDQDLLVALLPGGVNEAAARPIVEAYYGRGAASGPRHVTGLQSYARRARVEGPLTAVLVLLALAGAVLARGRHAAGSALFGGMAFALALLPVAGMFYGVRYATPMYGPLAAAAAIGLDAMAGRGSGRRSATWVGQSSSASRARRRARRSLVSRSKRSSSSARRRESSSWRSAMRSAAWRISRRRAGSGAA